MLTMLGTFESTLQADKIFACLAVKFMLFAMLRTSCTRGTSDCHSSKLLKGSLYLKELVDMSCWLESCHSFWNRCDLPTVGASHTMALPDQWHQALMAVDMEALEQLGVGVGVKTVELLF